MEQKSTPDESSEPKLNQQSEKSTDTTLNIESIEQTLLTLIKEAKQ